LNWYKVHITALAIALPLLAGLVLVHIYVLKPRIDKAAEDAPVNAPEVSIPSDDPSFQSFLNNAGHLVAGRSLAQPFDGSSMAGNYLAAQFAQNHHDWRHAVDYLDIVMARAPEEDLLKRKSMVLAMGAGRAEKAIDLAKEITMTEKGEEALLSGQGALARLFVATGHFKNHEFDKAATLIEKMPEDSLSAFIWPLLKSWAKAAKGEIDIENLQNNTLHLYHAILISDYLGQRDSIEPLLQRSLSAVDGLTNFDIERVADIYAHIGDTETAAHLYEGILSKWPDNPHIREKLDDLRSRTQTDDSAQTPPLTKRIASPEYGVAESFYDMATLLYHEASDESARVFAQMALYLNLDMDDARLLLGRITARNAQRDEAIDHYHSIAPTSPYYIEARRSAADLLEDLGRDEEALAELRQLAMQRGDLQSLIEIGNIQRRNNNHIKALESYNQAAERLGNDIPPSYWFLLFARGMSYEQSGQWDKAEADLQKALSFQPNHPHVLNYLGYAWADQGINLDESLRLLKKAATLEPNDGYIADSLGWVYFKTGNYAAALPYLEKAVELMPYDPVINDHLGDLYWLSGRYLEARFQWRRARNNIEDETTSQNEALIKDIAHKLQHGLHDTSLNIVREAKTSK